MTAQSITAPKPTKKRRKQKQRLTLQERLDIADRIAKGATKNELSREYQVAVSTINRIDSTFSTVTSLSDDIEIIEKETRVKKRQIIKGLLKRLNLELNKFPLHRIPDAICKLEQEPGRAKIGESAGIGQGNIIIMPGKAGVLAWTDDLRESGLIRQRSAKVEAGNIVELETAPNNDE